MHPDLSSIHLFLQAVKLGSLSKAAGACHISLSAASRRLSLLEHQLGVPLLDRLPGGVVPTQAGEAVARHAQQLMVQVDSLNAELSDYVGGAAGRVRLHANTSAMSQDLPRQLATWSEIHPRIKLDVRELRSGEIVEAVRQGLADVGVVTASPEADLRFEPYCRDRLCIVVPARHALRARSVAFADLLDYDFVGLDDSAMTTQTMKKTAEGAGRFLRLRIQVQSFEALCRLVAAGQGIGMLPVGSVDAFRQSMKLRTIHLRDDWANREMYLCFKKGRLPSPVARLVEFLLGQDGGGERAGVRPPSGRA